MGSVGAVLVHPDSQGLGVGRRMMERCLELVQPSTTILHATAAGRQLYEKLGFVPRGTLCRHEGLVTGEAVLRLSPQPLIHPLVPSLNDVVLQLAECGSGLHRPALLASLLSDSKGALIFEGEVATGFALFRRYGRGWAIGPVVARNEVAAAALIGHWLAISIGEFVRVDVTAEAGPAFSSWLDSLGLIKTSVALPMVRGEWPRADLSTKQFAILTQATA